MFLFKFFVLSFLGKLREYTPLAGKAGTVDRLIMCSAFEDMEYAKTFGAEEHLLLLF